MSPNTADPAILLPSLRDYLMGLGIVRKPTTPDPTIPPMWLDPKKGVPYPGQTDGLGQSETSGDIVIAAFPSTGIPPQPYMGFYRQKAVLLHIRAVKSPMIQRLYEHQLYPVLGDIQEVVDLSGLMVNKIMASRDLQRIDANEAGYEYNCEFMFDLWGS